MLLKTRGIIVRAIKYSETSIITDIYTEEKGMRSYIVSGVRSKNAKTKAGLLQLMSIVDLVVYHRDNKELTRIKEIKSAYVYQSIPFDIVKGAMGLFLTELIQKTIREQEKNQALFDFLLGYYQFLDTTTETISNLHIVFLLELSHFFGFQPQGTASFETPFFDFDEGSFVKTEPLHKHFLDKENALLMDAFLNCSKENSHLLKVPKAQRKQLLKKLLDYYYYHIDNMPAVNTHLVLEEVF